jgi:Mannosyltransferase putative
MQDSLYQAIERRRAAPAQYPDGRFEGRGIVICAGGERYFTCAWVLISILQRVHRTALPIQVWHLGRREMSEEMRLLLLEKGIEVVDAETVAARHPARLAGGWPLKPYAIAHSRFREVLYLDADTVPLVDPGPAFEWDAYRENGLLLWPDIVDLKSSNPIWARLNSQPTEHVSVDSGILLADKARAWEVLDLAILMNEHWEQVYDVLYGDKDTFLLSARLLKQAFGLLPHRPFVFDWDFVQRDPAGEPFLHHRTTSKWQLHYPNRPLAEPTLMASCEAALAELRSRWSGTVFHAPARSPQARAEEARLIGLRSFRFEPSAGGPHDIELLPGGRVSADMGLARHWAVVDRAGSLSLQFYAEMEPTETFERLADGSWRGVSCAPGFEVRLKARHDGAQSLAADDRLPRSAEHLVAALADPALFAAGYDGERATALAAALSLLNDTFDDVPELLSRHHASHALSTQWRQFLDQLVLKLTSARDQRVALVRREKRIGPRALDPAHYARPA